MKGKGFVSKGYKETWWRVHHDERDPVSGARMLALQYNEYMLYTHVRS